MKAVIINSVCGIGSTGRICVGIAEELQNKGYEVVIAYGRKDNVPDECQHFAKKISSQSIVRLNALGARLFDNDGFGIKSNTSSFVQWLEYYKPDLIWLHNLHGYYINVEVLFDWIKEHPSIEIKWTLHDCWAFTGHCTYFTMIGCEKWKKGCSRCPQKNEYPASYLLDKSMHNYNRKKALFSGINNLMLITPSKWLAELTRESFLSEYPVMVRYNTIDKTVFKREDNDNIRQIRQNLGIQQEIVILGVASEWNKRKGLDDFFALADMLDNYYVVVLVGLTRKQIKQIPQKTTHLKKSKLNVQKFPNAVIYVNKKNEDGQVVYNTDYNKSNRFSELISNRVGVAIDCGVTNAYKAITGENKIPESSSGCKKLIAIPRTGKIDELVELYSAADCLFNPTYEDNYPTVNLEAIACGTFVITYDTGGAKETIEVN